jgi:hypothetical protein
MKVIGISFMVVLFMVPQDPIASSKATSHQNTRMDKIARQQREKVVKDSGWAIPGIKEFTTLSSAQEKQFDGVTVSQKVYIADPRPVIDIDGNKVGHIDHEGIHVTPESARAKKQLFDLRGFSAYEVNGHVFAYSITLVPLAIEKQRRMFTGAMYRLLYFDEDGDGRFETRYTGFTMPKVPEWATKPS